jgi:cysteinyl-tRNA synthetase
MSKSLGNFFTVREVLKQYRPEIIRFFILSSHYRSPLNYSDEQLNEAATALNRLYTALRGVTVPDAPILPDYQSRFEQAMDDDFNTPVAVSVLFDLARELNKAKGGDTEQEEVLAASLKKLGGLLGILQADPDAWLKGEIVGLASIDAGSDTVMATGQVGLSSDQIEQQVQLRLYAKKAKNWALADQIRDQLKEQGIILEDAPNGTTSWRRG